MNKINQMCIESYFKKVGQDCDFKIELEETITTDNDAVCYIDDLVIPNVLKQ